VRSERQLAAEVRVHQYVGADDALMSRAVNGEIVLIRRRRTGFAEIADAFVLLEHNRCAVTTKFRLAHHTPGR
jgi:hypothetical protein